jgi:uncharacterized protein YecE (DUF72 family)
MRDRIGTAGWGIPRAVAGCFPGEGSILERYARVLPAVEINSSFYRPHKRATYERWAASTPPDFAFAVKLPRSITHTRRLVDGDAPLGQFLDQAAGLGPKLGAVLIQLPPSLGFDDTARRFIAQWRDRFDGPTACEPRHRTWFSQEAEAALGSAHIARVAADPAPVPAAAQPGGWRGLTYVRWHGSPRMYASPYPQARIFEAARMLAARPPGTPGWMIFDNTMLGAAAADALRMLAL